LPPHSDKGFDKLSPNGLRARVSGSIDIAQPSGGQRLAHLVHVQPEHAAGQLGALLAFVGLALGRGLERCKG
jgi:hypothetical protein